MTAKENLLAVLSGGAAEWLPVCLHITNANNLTGFLSWSTTVATSATSSPTSGPLAWTRSTA